jgi:molybdopterin synthase catalytic subunit
MAVSLTTEPFDPWREVRAHEDAAAELQAGTVGATAVFIGTMRDFSDGKQNVESMTLEHYDGMTQRHLETICLEAKTRWPILDALVIHRIGQLHPGEPIVLVAVWSAHRAAAFEACRFIMEDLKSKAPFWKKETSSDGARWVSQNTPATSAKSED